MELTYTIKDGYRLPDLLPPQEPETALGKYGLLRRRYLKEHRKVLFTNLLTSGRLNEHLAEIDRTARQRVEQTVTAMAQAEGVTEELKAAFTCSFRNTWPSRSRSASHWRFASTPGWGFLTRMMQERCSSARFSGVRLTNSGSMLLLKKPFQMTAALAYKHTRGRVGPIEVEKRRAGCVQLPRALIEFLAAAMRADHRLPRDLVTVIARQPALEPIHEPHESRLSDQAYRSRIHSCFFNAYSSSVMAPRLYRSSSCERRW